MTHAVATFFYLLLGHLVCDYSLQIDFVAQRKSPANSLPAVPWPYVMAGHAGTHAAAVALVLGLCHGVAWVPVLAFLELAAHFVIDVLKCAGKTSIHADQTLHLLCKAAWVVLLTVLP